MSGGEVLYLAHRLPWPPDRGDRIRSWHVLKALARLRPVHVVAPVDDPADLAGVAQVEAIAASVTTLPRRGTRGGAVLASLVTGLPASVALFDVPQLRVAAEKLIASGRIGTVYAYSGQMAHYVPADPRARFVMDFVDVDSAKFAAQAGKAFGLMGLLLRREARRLRAFEIATARRADAVLFASDAEAALFTQTTGCAARGLSNGVDAEHFAPGVVPPVAKRGPLLVFTGQMDYAPNVEAVTDFAKQVLPQLPQAQFAIVGRSPTAAIWRLASERVIVTGEVADTRPWLEAADVVVAPLKLARGIQNKVLEAMAMARPVVASSGAAEGIVAQRDHEIVVADDPAAQAAAITDLLAAPARAQAVGTAARACVVERYSWAACLAPLADIVA